METQLPIFTVIKSDTEIESNCEETLCCVPDARPLQAVKVR